MESDNILNLLNNLGTTKIWIKLGCCPIPLSGDIDLSDPCFDVLKIRFIEIQNTLKLKTV